MKQSRTFCHGEEKNEKWPGGIEIILFFCVFFFENTTNAFSVLLVPFFLKLSELKRYFYSI